MITEQEYLKLKQENLLLSRKCSWRTTWLCGSVALNIFLGLMFIPGCTVEQTGAVAAGMALQQSLQIAADRVAQDPNSANAYALAVALQNAGLLPVVDGDPQVIIETAVQAAMDANSWTEWSKEKAKTPSWWIASVLAVIAGYQKKKRMDEAA